MRRFIIGVVSLIFLLASFQIVFAQKLTEKARKGEKTIELAILLKTLVWGSEKDISAIPVVWQNNPQRAKPGYRGDISSYLQQGPVVVTINGKYLKDMDGKPAEWGIGKGRNNGKEAIIMLGTHYGVPDLLANFLSEPDLVSELEVEKLLATAGIHSKLIKCKENAATSGERVYEISLPGQPPTWLAYGWSGGSGGVSIDFAILTSKTELDRIECFNYLDK
jgi:hypothetical protein